MRRFTWILLSQNAQVIAVDQRSLTVGFKTAGARDSFLGGGSEEILRQAAIDMVGADWKIETVVDSATDPGAQTAMRVTRPAVPDAPEPPSGPEPPDPGSSGAPPAPAARPAASGAARARISATRGPGAAAEETGPRSDPDADAHRDDPSAADNGIDTTELLARELGATVIEEIPHS